MPTIRNKKGFVNIFTVLAVVAVSGYFLMKPRTLLAESLQQAPPISFLKPQSGTVVNSGEVLAVEVQGQGLKVVMLIAPNFAEKTLNDGSGIFKFQYQVPLDTVGEVKLGVIGKSIPEPVLDKNFKVLELPSSAEIIIIVQPNPQINIQSLSVPSDFMLLKVGQSEQIRVLGKLSDGSQINITPPEFGTQYVTGRDFTKKYSPSANVGTEIIRVDNNGNVTGINPGEDSVVVSHKNTQAENVRVLVE